MPCETFRPELFAKVLLLESITWVVDADAAAVGVGTAANVVAGVVIGGPLVGAVSGAPLICSTAQSIHCQFTAGMEGHQGQASNEHVIQAASCHPPYSQLDFHGCWLAREEQETAILQS